MTALDWFGVALLGIGAVFLLLIILGACRGAGEADDHRERYARYHRIGPYAERERGDVDEALGDWGDAFWEGE